MRAALYARFSTDLQRAESIADQLAVCRRQAQTLDVTVVKAFKDLRFHGVAISPLAEGWVSELHHPSLSSSPETAD